MKGIILQTIYNMKYNKKEQTKIPVLLENNQLIPQWLIKRKKHWQNYFSLYVKGLNQVEQS